MKITCIYRIYSIATDRFYIGSAKNFAARKAGHLCDLRNNKHHSRFLQRTYNKYGIADLNFEILEEVHDINTLIEREQFYLDSLKPEFNTSPTAGNCLGSTMSSETKQKLRQLNLGEKNKFFGRKHSEETKIKISQAKIGQSAGEKNYFYGKKFTGTLNYMFGRTHTEQSVNKIKERRKTQTFSAETRLKMGLARTGAKNHGAKSVFCITNGITYPTVSEAGKSLNLWRQKIGKVCMGKIKSTGGYKFKYA